jgi:carbamoyltransferase
MSMTAGAVLGLSGYYHDSAACLVVDGQIVAAVQEERLSRRKHDSAFPSLAAAEVLRAGGARISDVEAVVFYELPFLHAERVLHSQIRFAPGGLRAFPHAVRSLLGGKLWVEQAIAAQLGYEGPVLFVPHHLAHAASAYLPSPFEEAAILTVDGVGEWSTSTFGAGRAGDMELLAEQRFPHSLGLLYATLTAWAGFRVNSGEYKLMGLAPYGRPRFAEALRREVVHLTEDGGVRLNLAHFDFPAGASMGRPSLSQFLGGPPRPLDAPLTEREADIAASAQSIVEEALTRMARHVRARTGLAHLCMAGGVALNSVAVGKVLEAGIFDDVFVQPAAGDAGGALGAALLGAQELTPGSRPTRAEGGDALRGAFLGAPPTAREMRGALERWGIRHQPLEPAELDAAVVEALAEGQVLGWYQGPMEFGPRALGGRSILADARGDTTRDRVNREMKRRESFRPFAPAVLEEEAARWFDVSAPCPYMTRTARVRGFAGAEPPPGEGRVTGWKIESPLPATTHVDGSARLQTVSAGSNPRFHALLSAFFRRTGVPVLLNTSFNLRGEPLVASPEDACRTFAHTGLDALAMGPFLVRRSAHPPEFWRRIDAPILHPD